MKKLLSILMALAIIMSLCILPANAAIVAENITFTGVPTAAEKTFKDGNLQIDLVAGDGVTVTNPDGAVKIVNNEADSNNVKLRIKYPVDKKNGSLKISYTFRLLKNEDGVADNIVPSNFGMYSYKKDMETELHSSIWFLDKEGKWRAGSNNKVKDDTDYTINYTLNLNDGAYDTRRVSTKITGGEGTADITDGFGMTEVTITTPAEDGNGILFKDITVTESSESYSDHAYLINGVPTIGQTYNGVTVSTTTKGTGLAVNEDGKILIKDTTDGKVVTLGFEKTIAYPSENNKTVYVELLCSTDKAVASDARLHFRVKTDTESSSGGSYAPADIFTEEEKGKTHRLGFWLDLGYSGNFRHYKYVDDACLDEGGKKVTGNTISQIFMEFWDKGGATLTIHDVKFMELEPYNYVAKENKYYDKSVLLLNGISHIGNTPAWSGNKMSFECSLNGDAKAEKLPLCGGYVFSGTDGISVDGMPGDYARLIVNSNVTKDAYPNGYIRVTYDFTLAGENEQSVAISGRNSTAEASWPINHGNKLNPGDHKIEFLYNPTTNQYTYYVDGVKSRIIDNPGEGLPEIMLEYKGAVKTDTLTLKNVTVKNLEDNGEDSISDITVSEDKLSASVTITAGKEFSKVAGSIRFIIAAYDENKVTAVDVQHVDVTTGENKIDVNLESLNGGTKVQALLWNDMEPMVDAVER